VGTAVDSAEVIQALGSDLRQGALPQDTFRESPHRRGDSNPRALVLVNVKIRVQAAELKQEFLLLVPRIDFGGCRG